MCRQRSVHFSQHDVRPFICVDAFRDDDAGVYVDPQAVTHCHCGQFVQHLMPLVEHGEEQLEPCEYHNCCVVWTQKPTLCRRTRDDWTALGGDPELYMYEDCDNELITFEYHPLQMAMAPDPETDEMAEPQWTENRPVFPIGLFYSHHAPTAHNEIHEALSTRLELAVIGSCLLQKRDQAREKLEAVEQTLKQLAEVERPPAALKVRPPAQDLEALDKSLETINDISAIIRCCSLLQSRLIKEAASALELVRDRPLLGDEEVAAPEGSFRLSVQAVARAQCHEEEVLPEARASTDWKRAEKLRDELLALRWKLWSGMAETSRPGRPKRKRCLVEEDRRAKSLRLFPDPS